MFTESDCQNADSPGKCLRTDNCQPAIEQIKKKRFHSFSRCGFEGRHEIVCCPSVKPEGGARSKEACQQWKKGTVTAFPQIVNGEKAENGEFPHMAALGFYSIMDQIYYFNCAGSIISERYILTAAHCIANIEGNKLKIARIGTVEVPESVTRPNPAIDYNVEQVKVHEQFKRKAKLNDIALVKLERSLSWTDFIRPACLYLKGNDPELLYVTGWGDLGVGLSRSLILQKAALKPAILSDCNVTYVSRSKLILHETQICAADVRMDACQGDSGGPLQVPEPNKSIFSVVGIVSHGIGCGGKYPGVYTRVYSYLSWIENIVWP